MMDRHIAQQACDIVGRIYTAVLTAYDTNDELALQSLNKLCVRLVFLFYAEDAGLFPKKNQFCDYMKDFSPAHFRRALVDLFRILNTPEEERDKYEEDDLKEFPYVNGGLFSEKIDVPQFSPDAVKFIIKDGGGFDWSQISPTIFGAIFESTLNPAHRREGGMHYTSPENIHKVIDPLFLDGYRAQFQAAMAERGKARTKKLLALQDELACAKFFDPAAGSGNFLTESYRSLRRLENDILRELMGTSEKGGLLGFEELNPIKVSINQFYGIEINDFAVSVAKTAIWIAESQCFKETEEIIYRQMDFLPLKTEANIHEGNALRMDWREVLPPSDEVYLMGNPPFVGASLMNADQKKDMVETFKGWKCAGKLDYVCAWYKKAADYMAGKHVCAAFVSTNSVTQGDSVATLWKPLFERGIKIFFAHRTFQWNSESKNKVGVHCVIVGFSYDAPHKKPVLYTHGQGEEVAHINPYLVDAPTVFIESRTKPLCDVPLMMKGNQPTDGGNLLFKPEELEKFLKQEPKAKHWIKKFVGAEEFINNKPRYCLWLVNCPPQELRAMPLVMKRVEKVREFRLASKFEGTRKKAESPTLFRETNNPKNYLAIPEVSSEQRRYIPLGYLSAEVIAGNKLFMLPDAPLYHFGILQSNVHMAWMRVTCGRRGSSYSYSGTIVYNNFPFPEPTDDQRAAIEQTAQAILDARTIYPESSLADLYDVNTMPKELREAHRANNRAVMKCYGLPLKTTEAETVALLMERYEELTHRNTPAIGRRRNRVVITPVRGLDDVEFPSRRGTIPIRDGHTTR